MKPAAIIAIFLLIGLASAQVPDSWRKADAEGEFSFFIPKDFKKIKLQGIDSYVERYEGKDITISFDYGMYSNQFQDWPEDTEYQKATIDGEAAKIGTRKEASSEGTIYHSQVNFSDGHGHAGLSMGATCLGESNFKIVQTIFRSIKFTKKTEQDAAANP